MSVSDRPADDDVISTVDRSGTRPLFIVADISRDDAWVSVPENEACPLDGWR